MEIAMYWMEWQIASGALTVSAVHSVSTAGWTSLRRAVPHARLAHRTVVMRRRAIAP